MKLGAAMAKGNPFGKTGIYMRLSRDDDKAGESMSIEHQRIILQKYVAEQRGTVIDEYIDDGWSGTNFERPEVKRMLSDAQSGRIDTIVVKDLSRFGRNYIQVGQYIELYFINGLAKINSESKQQVIGNIKMSVSSGYAYFYCE